MTTTGVVESVDVFEERVSDLLARLPYTPPDEFGFRRFEEGFDGRIIIAISLAAHGCLKAKLAQPLLIIISAVLATPV